MLFDQIKRKKLSWKTCCEKGQLMLVTELGISEKTGLAAKFIY